MVRVSAIIPVYNGASTVGRAIESALSQQFDGLEVITVDDGSTDATPQTLRSFGSRIRVVRQANRGRSEARNAGVRVTSGEYIAFLDADDAWMPGKLRKMVNALDAARHAVLAYSDLVSTDAAGAELPGPIITSEHTHAPSMTELLTHYWPIFTSTVVMRRETFEVCGRFDARFKSPGYEDTYFWIVAREQGEFLYIPERLVLYRSAPAVKYTPGCVTFIRLVEQRYGSAARSLIREVVGAQVSSLGHEGLLAMRRGDRKQARRAFVLALRANPLHLRTAMRLLRTFLPPAVARSFTGRTRNERRYTDGNV